MKKYYIYNRNHKRIGYYTETDETVYVNINPFPTITMDKKEFVKFIERMCFWLN